MWNIVNLFEVSNAVRFLVEHLVFFPVLISSVKILASTF